MNSFYSGTRGSNRHTNMNVLCSGARGCNSHMNSLIIKIIITILSKTQILKKPSALYKEHGGSGGAG